MSSGQVVQPINAPVGQQAEFRLPSRLAVPCLDPVTRSISAVASARAAEYMRRAGWTILGENSRRHVMGRGPEIFSKSLTADSAIRLRDFYPLLERASAPTGFVPRLIEMIRIDAEVSVACFEHVSGQSGTTAGTQECADLYAALHTSTSRSGARTAQALIDVCRNEMSTWTEDLLQAWHPAHWNDPKILTWAGADAATLTDVGVPTLRAIPSLLAALSHDGVCAPVHADLYMGNHLRTPTGRAVIFDWDEGYWGLPGMGLQILLREARDDGVGQIDLRSLAPQFGLDPSELAVRTLASAVVEIAGIRQSLREMNRPVERHAAYLAAWACRYDWVISRCEGGPSQGFRCYTGASRR